MKEKVNRAESLLISVVITMKNNKWLEEWMISTLYFDCALSVYSSQLVGRLTLVCGSVLQVSVLDGQRHQIFVD